jgi:hypothetical protein
MIIMHKHGGYLIMGSIWLNSDRKSGKSPTIHYSPAMFPRLYGCLAVALFGPSCATLLNLPDEPTAAGLDDLQFSFL